VRPLTVDEVRPPSAYEAGRQETRSRLAELKRPRRVELGPLLTLTFENRSTLLGAVEELLRAERIEDAAQIAAEVEAFNHLLPAPNELVAIVFLNMADAADLAGQERRLAAVASALVLEVGDARIQATVEDDPGGARGARAVRFRLGDGPAQALAGGAHCWVTVEEGEHRVRVALAESTLAGLIDDISGAR
jgi:hypothetical protein